MTATNMCSNFGSFSLVLPLITFVIHFFTSRNDDVMDCITLTPFSENLIQVLQNELVFIYPTLLVMELQGLLWTDTKKCVKHNCWPA